MYRAHHRAFNTQKDDMIRKVQIKRLIILILSCLVTWSAGLTWFASLIPSVPQTDRTMTDAIVVLTGGSGRLGEGLSLLKNGNYSRQLFISGVSPGVSLNSLLRSAKQQPEDSVCCIKVGYRADNTAGNAEETHNWVTKSKINSIRLVTSNYHMPRSLFEFRRVLTKVKIVPHPVLPFGIVHENWWLNPHFVFLIISEYNKFIVTLTISFFSEQED